jgi:hypothetical protein
MWRKNQIFFYGMYKENIDVLPNGRSVPYVAVQCDRVHRPKGTGTKVELHSYPISLVELQNDFGNGGRPFVNLILKNQFDIP